MKSTGPSSNTGKMLYIFGAVFTMFMLLSMTFDSFLKSGWWLRSLDIKWADIRVWAPNLFAGDDEMDFVGSFGKYYNYLADERIFIAAIDEETVSKMGYPFKRKHYGTLIEKLNKLGVKAIGLDVTLSDSDREDKASDKIMSDAVAKAGNVSVLIYINPENGEIKYPFKGLGEAANNISHPHVEKDIEANGQVRRVSLFSDSKVYDNLAIKTRCDKECTAVGLPLLAAGTYAIYTGTPLKKLEEAYGTDPKLVNFRVPQKRPFHPGWKNREKLGVNESVYRHISVLDILEDRLSNEEKAALKGGIAFIGSTAAAAFDHYPSPFMTAWPGVELHANVVDNMLRGDFLKSFPVWAYLPLMLFSIWLPIMLSKYSIKVISLTSIGFMAALMVVNFLMLVKHYDMPYLGVFIGILVPFVYVTVHKALMESREKKWIKNTFGQYLSPKVVDIITKDPSKLSLGGEKRDMTAFFLDLAGFTTMSEKMTPEELTTMLNDYLSAFTEIILKHDGTVDKYIGDCIVAFWNAPLDQAEHRKLALLAAVDCQVEMARLNATLTQYTIKPAARVGVNSGPMVVGNMGSKTRLSYTVMGDAVNLASRMEGANKFFHSRIMTSEATFGELKDVFDHRYLGSIRVVGKAIPVRVYEPFARKGEADPEVKAMLKHYEAGMDKFYKGDYAGSLPDFQAALAARPNDGPSQYYIETAELYMKEPPKDWDQSFNLTSKG
ncbi:MAG: adenylate/guanylate cyclase domain-containing protein [Elusimicrobiota bacterium]|nr:adenylate/guanylate cyclase domain-containing protein [Elusimicrobiota bacterium]